MICQVVLSLVHPVLLPAAPLHIGRADACYCDASITHLQHGTPGTPLQKEDQQEQPAGEAPAEESADDVPPLMGTPCLHIIHPVCKACFAEPGSAGFRHILSEIHTPPPEC